ncbi:hypothetical protein [Absidia glauca]|uniref:No apical meristem-associated C-terminal domain-containing protein n=1 Tax=Absidia glauca TaxID=4829 RepID=A0A168R8G7_ABSGL|nr:hypothetical protein [Absidia glauca]
MTSSNTTTPPSTTSDGPVRNKNKNKNWSRMEDEQLCRSYLAVSNDAITGVDQHVTTFWDRVKEHYYVANGGEDPNGRRHQHRSFDSLGGPSFRRLSASTLVAWAIHPPSWPQTGESPLWQKKGGRFLSGRGCQSNERLDQRAMKRTKMIEELVSVTKKNSRIQESAFVWSVMSTDPTTIAVPARRAWVEGYQAQILASKNRYLVEEEEEENADDMDSI